LNKTKEIISCNACRGTGFGSGWVGEGAPCGVCNGTGQIDKSKRMQEP
jgi:DnaJ-class molecular chaperone